MKRKLLKSLSSSGCCLLFITGAMLIMPPNLAGQGKIYPQGNIFPLGLFAVINKSDMEIVKKAGFNMVHIYDSKMDISSAKAYLQEAKEVGIKVKMNMPATKYQSGSDKFWINYVKACAEYSALAWWYIPEEEYDLVATERLVNIIKTSDPKNRPICTYLGQYNQIKKFMPVIDIMEGGQYYPYYTEPRIATKIWIDEIVENSDEGDVAIGALQFFDFGKDDPTVQDARHDAYLDIVSEAKGLYWFSYYRGIRECPPSLWEGIKQIVYEVGGQSDGRVNPDPLGPVILSPDIPQSITMEIISGRTRVPGPYYGKRSYYNSINWLQKEHNGVIYLIAVNSAESTVMARFGNIPSKVSGVQVMFEDRNIIVTNGSFIDTFNKIGVHIYKMLRLNLIEPKNLIIPDRVNSRQKRDLQLAAQELGY